MKYRSQIEKEGQIRLFKRKNYPMSGKSFFKILFRFQTNEGTYMGGKICNTN